MTVDEEDNLKTEKSPSLQDRLYGRYIVILMGIISYEPSTHSPL